MTKINLVQSKTYRPGGGVAVPSFPRPHTRIWATQIFWAAREIWGKPLFKEVCMCVCVCMCVRVVFLFFVSKSDILN